MQKGIVGAIFFVLFSSSVFSEDSNFTVIERCDRSIPHHEKNNFSLVLSGEIGGLGTSDPEVRSAFSRGGKVYNAIKKLTEVNVAINCKLLDSGKTAFSYAQALNIVKTRLSETGNSKTILDFSKHQAALATRFLANADILNNTNEFRDRNLIVDWMVKNEKKYSMSIADQNKSNDFMNQLISGITTYRALLKEADELIDVTSKYRATGATPEYLDYVCTLSCRTYDHLNKVNLGVVKVNSLKNLQRSELNNICLKAGGANAPRPLHPEDLLEAPGKWYADTFDCKPVPK